MQQSHQEGADRRLNAGGVIVLAEVGQDKARVL